MKWIPDRAPAARRLPVAAVVAALCTASAHAGVVEFDNGLEAVWSLNASLAGGWRLRDADPALIGKGDGGTGSGYTAGAAEKNFAKGDNFSTLLRVVGDVNLKKGDSGLVLRAKAWDNLRLSGQSVPFGATSNGFAPDTRLSDKEFDTELSKFRGAKLLDAYAYTRFDLSEGVQAKVKLGNHVVNFGESLFVPGVNQYSVLDINALRQPGTLIKEAILPVPQVSANVGLPDGASVEGFYQFQWKRTSVDGCGTYWSPAIVLNCTNTAAPVASDAKGSFTSSQYWNGVPALGGLNFRFSKLADREPNDKSQFGLAFKKTSEALDTEFGAYFVNYTTHLPLLSAVRDLTMVPGSAYYRNPATGGPLPLGSMQWDYSANNIQVTGLSASTVIGGWSVAGEASYTKGYPVQINSVDALLGLAQPNAAVPGTIGIGPVASRFGSTAAPLGSNTYVAGYDRKNKTQLQASTIKTFSNVLGASSASLVGEVAWQNWSGIGDPYTSVRYGRGFEFGAAQHATFGGACPAAATNAVNCTQDGYYTRNAWGVRLLGELEFPNAIAGVSLKPRLFLSQDVKGWSADNLFSQGRRVVSVGVRAEYLRRYYLDMSVTTYNHGAHFDSFHDRDFIGAVVGASF
jgi:hypothetical protein